MFWMTLALLLGAVWGSFLNVVIYRLPEGLSVVRPASRCPACESPIRWFQNVPVLSWLALRGRCARCKVSIPVRYPLVEAATAAFALAAWLKLSRSIDGVLPDPTEVAVAWVFTFALIADLIVIALIDLDTMRIPDELSLPGVLIGLASALFCSRVTGVDIEQSLLGLLVGGGALLSITYGYFALTGREGMGLGDYRLMALVGAFLGWRSLLFVFIASAFQGLFFALVVRSLNLEDSLPDLDDEPPSAEGEPVESEPESSPEESEPASFRHMAIPFGPFIALSALEWFVFEEELMTLFYSWVVGV